MTSLVVIGQGYVGLPMTLTAVEVAMRAVGHDTDNGRLARPWIRGSADQSTIATPTSSWQCSHSAE